MAKFFKDKDKFFIDKVYYVLGWPFRMAYRGVRFVVSKIRQAIFKRNPEAEEKAEQVLQAILHPDRPWLGQARQLVCKAH